jgi:HK97 family phage portal protein
MAGLRARLASFFGRETRAVDAHSLLGLLGTDPAGRAVTAAMSENIAAVIGCVQAIASGVAFLPAYVYRREGTRRVEVTDHPLCDLIRRGANPVQTWSDTMESLVASALLHGNGLLRIDPNGAGLQFIPWGWVQVQLLETGRLAYDVAEGGLVNGSPGRRYRLLQSEVIHLRDRSEDGRIGRSRLSRANDTFQLAHEANRTALAIYRNGNRMTGVLETDAQISPDGLANLRESWNAMYAGSENSARTPILEGGLKFKAMSISPEDAELLASRKFALEDICRVFQVPPPMVQDLSHGTFTNSREAARWFCQFTLTPWIRKIEAEFARTFFPAGSGLELELDMSGLLRADPESRWISHKTAVDAGILDPDEIREIEGYDPRPAAAAAPAGAAPAGGTSPPAAGAGQAPATAESAAA